MDLEALKIDRSSTQAHRARGRGRRRRNAIVLLAVAAGLVWIFRAPLGGMLDRLRLPEVAAMRVSRTSAAAAAAAVGTAANGYVVARTRAALSADTPGRVVELNVTEGSVVKKGDVVARLFSDEYEAALRTLDARLVAARSTVERARAERDVAASGIEGDRFALEAAGARRDAADARLRLARKTKERALALLEANVESQGSLDDATAREESAHAELAAAAAEVERASRSLDQSRQRLTAAEAAVAEVEAQLPVLQAQRDQAQATLEKTNVRAPFDGIVVLKDAEVGEVVSPNAQGGQSRGSIATMVDFETLEVQVELPETSLERIAVGDAATIYLDAYPGSPYEGRVLRIWPTANRSKATVEVRVGFATSDDRLRPEMGTRVVFQNQERPEEPQGGRASEPAEGSILIPETCVVRVEGTAGVFLLERDVARFRAVRTGPTYGGRVTILEGLDEGDRVVIEPPDALRDGQRVRIKNA